MGADPRAGERTFQLLHQVTGRAGRMLAAGRGFVQTYMPEHPVMQAIISGDREAFLEHEIRHAPARPAAALRPPRRARRLRPRQGAGASRSPATSPAARPPPSASRCWARPRRRSPSSAAATAGACCVKAPRELDVQAYLRAWLAALPTIKGDLRLTVDIDPYSFL